MLLGVSLFAFFSPTLLSLRVGFQMMHKCTSGKKKEDINSLSLSHFLSCPHVNKIYKFWILNSDGRLVLL